MANWSQVDLDVAAIMGTVDTLMQFKRAGESRSYKYYHPSEFGKCLRKMQYHHYAYLGLLEEPQDNVDSQMLRLWGKGHNMHSRWALYFEELGVLRGYWACQRCNTVPAQKSILGVNEKLGIFKPKSCTCGCTKFEYVELQVHDEDLNISGHVDMILDFSEFDVGIFQDIPLAFNGSDLPDEPVVVDMKTINNAGFNKVINDGPSLTYQIQLTIYVNLLGCAYGLLIYENKDNSRTASFKIPKNTDTVFESIKRQARLMKGMTPKKLLPPPRPASKDSYECRKCVFSKVCKKSAIWNNPNLDQIRKKFYTQLL